MNKAKFRKFKKVSASSVCVVLSILLFAFSFFFNPAQRNPERVAARVERRIDKRMRLLDKHIEEAIEQNHSEWMKLSLPSDMVVYRYVYDTLQSWSNQFPVVNDDISYRTVFQRLSNLRTTITSPLRSVSVVESFMNIGPKWYIAKSVSGGMACKVIAGIEVQDLGDSRAGNSGINKRLGIPDNFSISVLGDSGGVPVTYHGIPLFKIFSETPTATQQFSAPALRWCALLLVALAFVFYLSQHRRFRNYFIVAGIIIVAAVIAYFWGRNMSTRYAFFSPLMYAGGTFLYSFGALVILNLTIILLIVSTFLVRKSIYRRVIGRKGRISCVACLLSFVIVSVSVYLVWSLFSLIMNSSISWELYLWMRLSLYSLVTYLLYACMMFCVLLLVQMVLTVVFCGRRKVNILSRNGLVIFAIAAAGFFLVISSVLGFRKEENRIAIMSSRLAADRDLALEIVLRSSEEDIASDSMVSTLSHEDQTNYVILNRLTETYLTKVSQNYNIAITVCANSHVNCFAQYEQRFMNGTPLSDRSRFVFTYDDYGNPGYLGMFVYYSPEAGLSRILVEITDKVGKGTGTKGYYGLLGLDTNPAGVEIPSEYSYARYKSGRLIRYSGDYAYPSFSIPETREGLPLGATHIREDKYVYFINRILDDETIVMTRSVRSWLTYFVTFSYLTLLNLLLLLPFIRTRRKEKVPFRRNYYRSRINWLLFVSLFLTLVAMSVLTVTFVARRNGANMYSVMSEKMTSIQTILEERCREVPSLASVSSMDLVPLLEGLGAEMNTDITIFSPNGKVFASTSSDVFERLEFDSRMNENAYYNVRYKNLRLFINQEKIRDEGYFALYAPIFNRAGERIAIACVPYTDQNVDFMYEAVSQAAMFVNVFLILILLTLFVSTAVVNNLFRPLAEMGRKMNSADLSGMNYIVYKRDDEVSTLVDAYNRMVHDLYQSMKLVTQSERDKAWSEMARQVAHEIKNPLTPIKLDLQRLIRLKERNDPSWSEKFDRISAVILEHIDILAETANEFSTFAKLYTEEPVLMDIDQVLREQIMVFDNRENISISYMGLPNAFVLAPKPQLIRVFVNLLTNAVQAVDISQNEARDAGREVVQGRILVSLRNSVRDGFYDIVFEDNGTGVKDENQGKLFTPNFTTKSAGTGLGLAICRNIVEKCNGTISYQKSFALSGACFVVSLPKQSSPS